ncbi:DUF4857 domain-containing protein [Desulfonatronovibrio hydrogenovorans]|uniref:DUF4857 domain-containing protein n=1 Tax=Desulfonatronovibrio hydrogenovorans TaxID=53245 RepID=UPI00049164C9|nr:DUF4857 domain-containing protein [Desulfonatronovibrio hydrogenovorans]
MTGKISRLSLLILAVMAMSYILPAAFDKVVDRKAEEPLLFFSPVLKKFVYQKSLGGHRFIYTDEDGVLYDRQEFEALLPFLYHRNLEIHGMLPLVIDGQSFDLEEIRAGRQAVEIRSRQIRINRQQIDLFPLFNNDPAVPMIPFPEDVFRITHNGMEFKNADYNRIDRELSEVFTHVLEEKRFVYPATVISGNPTNLKPFDEGYFIRDDSGQVFHVKRAMNQPVVVKTGIDPGLDILDMIISENRRMEFYGIVFTTQGEIFLISYDDYRLIQIPVNHFEPPRMDFKLLINPLYRTAIISSNKGIYGLAMDSEYRAVHDFFLERTAGEVGLADRVRDFFLPYQITLTSDHQSQAKPGLEAGGPWSLAGVFAAMAIFIIFSRKCRKVAVSKIDLIVVFLSGFYGLLAVCFMRSES